MVTINRFILIEQFVEKKSCKCYNWWWMCLYWTLSNIHIHTYYKVCSTETRDKQDSGWSWFLHIALVSSQPKLHILETVHVLEIHTCYIYICVCICIYIYRQTVDPVGVTRPSLLKQTIYAVNLMSLDKWTRDAFDALKCESRACRIN